MQKKNDKFLGIVKKDYNNQLEVVLEKKYFDEDVKSILLSILYKIESSYKDYKQVKQNVQTKDEFIQNIINIIQQECDEIKLVKPYSEESKIIGNKTFLVEKNKKRIICHNVERKLLYCISKINKKDKIIKDKYFVINETVSNLINTGNNINNVEPLRDFNGYSWTTILREIESIEHNIIYQNLVMLVGNEFLDRWVNNKEIIIDYMEDFENKMKELYGKENSKNFIEILKEISILLEVKFNSKNKEKILRIKEKIDNEIEKIEDSKKFVVNTTEEKIKLTKEIKNIDEIINNKTMLQEEYEKRNEKLPLEEKIFSIRILSKLMSEEREKKIEELEKLNQLLNPQNFVKYKKDLERKERVLKVLETENIQKDINKLKLKLQKVFLRCFESKIEKAGSKQELIKLIYEFRYYCVLPYDYEKIVNDTKELSKELENVGKILLQKSHKMKIIERLSKNEDIDYELLKNLFSIRSINLEEISVKVTKEKEKYFVQLLDENSIEEKYELKNGENIRYKDLEIRLNKKVKVFYRR